jgi:nucleoside transporter
MSQPGLQPRVRVRLSAMMFLQYAFNGIWIIPLGAYLGDVGFSDIEIGSIYGTFALGGIIAPFFVGMIADRFFAAQKVLGVLNLVAAGLLLLASQSIVTEAGEPRYSFFWWIIFGHFLCYMPTWALTNTIALAQMSNPGKQFPGIRVMGTIGWIVVSAASLISLHFELNIEMTRYPMIIGAGIGGLVGVYSFFLPDTPAKPGDKKPGFKEVLGVEALALFRDRNFAIFAVASFLIMFPGMFYWAFCNMYLNEIGMQAAMFKQSIGQMVEMIFLIIMPWFFVRLGVKKMLLIGMAAWIARFVCFSAGDLESMAFFLYLGFALHGVCFDFYFVTAQLYTDRKADKRIQAQAQGLISLITFGLGWLVGSNLAGWVVGKHVIDVDVAGKVVMHDWSTIWLYPAGMAAVIAVLFMLTFRDDLKVIVED